MSLFEKLILPLLDEKLTKEDISKDYGFVGIYTNDINRPVLDNHTFLMYDLSVNSKYAYERDIRFRQFTNIYNTKIEMIGGKAYCIYAFTNVNPDIKRLFNGEKPRHINSVVRILSYWRGYDAEVNCAMLTKQPVRIKRTFNQVPEFDYRQGPFEWLVYKKSGVVE